MKWREENTLCRHGEIELISSKKKKKQTLNKEQSFQNSNPGRASDF